MKARSKSKSWYPVVAVLALASPTAAQASDNVIGKWKIDLELGIGGGREMVIREPSMCEGKASAEIKWNKKKNLVQVKAKYDGLPYKPSFCFPEDPSTAYNTYPPCVTEGAWQIWFAVRAFTRTSIFYYDSVSGDLIANQYDLPPGGPPPGSMPVELPVAQMVGSPLFESNPANLKANVTFDFHYDGIQDLNDSPGTFITIIPFNLYDEDSYYLYYTNAILPDSEAQNWDDTLADVESGLGAVTISSSVEPVPKPPELLTHDQLMIGWTNSYPDEFNEPLPPEAFDDPDCGTEQIYIPFPGGEVP
jgi:hypothetical protein